MQTQTPTGPGAPAPEAAAAAPAAPADPLAALLADYTPLKGVPDELLDRNGAVRPVWKGFLDQLAALPREELDLACLRGSQYLSDAGVFFRHYGPDSQEEREWPLAHLPLLIAQQEWDGIAAGLVERADLLERIMADLYGANQLVADGLLPAELLASSPEWLRPLVGVTPRDGHYLHMLAFDIGRGPEGQWWVLGDRAQAPSGAGFALETRMATARSFPGLMSQANVARLAGFFRGFRDALLALRAEEDSRVAILTPGPLTDTYFEHAYIARYLGFLLVQGEDLVVRDGRLMVHTVGGLRPISVLWRRLDSAWLDPLELNEDSQIGTPGILSALRAGQLSMVNAPGSGVLEARALMAFIPAIARRLLGRELKLPNIATWWCGSAAARDYVTANAARMTIDRALSTSLPFDHSPDVVIGGKRADGQPFDPAMIQHQAGALAAQQIVSLSTAPALDEGRLVARPFSMRVILARTAQGWQVMPGGFARIGHSDVSADISVQRGGSVCDVWVVGPEARPDDTLLAGTTGARPSLPQLAALPTRAADNLFWLGRYSERVEQKIRLQRAYHLRLAESGRDDLPLVQYLAQYLAGQGVDASQPFPPGLMADLDAAMGSAGRIRDRFSTDGWNALTDLRRTAGRLAPRLKPGDDAARALSVLLRKISGFSGLVHENMYHATGWRFLSLGRAIERAWSTAAMLVGFAQPDTPHGTYEIAIEAGDAVMTHRMRFSAAFTRETVLDLLLLDEAYPRSVLAQLDDILGHLDWLEKLTHDLSGKPTPIRAEVMKLRTELATSPAEAITSARLIEISNATAAFSGLLADTYLR
ncbi:circularly permuted type 2 ATP-grasp protein [Pseudooceanicola sp. 200-1SW]|uniref:circularly permuted type 2 ATP-grasp protein n=1 Tax=Pseudooceanicola sp. 200-1SW TaxID=3425949 RepID=UPI003D7FDADE